MNIRDRRAGFTLIEILVVISITILLLGLILGPVVQTFNLTRRANAMVQAQDTARRTLEQISRELGQAMFVYDNSNSPVNASIERPDGSKGTYALLFGKVDFILPNLTMHCNRPDHPAGKPRDYEREDDAWPTCPYCAAANIKCGPDDVEARPKQPLSQDTKVVRYFIGLADPETNQNNTKMPMPGYRDWPQAGPPSNGFILYRAEFSPKDPNLFRRPNDDANLDPDQNDPDFFNPWHNGQPNIAPNGQPYWQNWKNIAHAQPVGPQKDTDLVIIRTDATETQIVSVTPSVRFQLTAQTNDSFQPAFMTDEAADTPAALPTVYRASYGAWGDSSGAYTPEMYDVSVVRDYSGSGNNNVWFRTQRATPGDPNSDLCIYKYSGAGAATEVFNISAHANGLWGPNERPECAFLVDPSRGQVTFDFPDSDVIHNSDIVDMNANVRANWNSGTAPERRFRILRFADAAGFAPQYRPRIVPGSEQIIGPDMTPGLDQSQIRMVRYERVPQNLGEPGRNQYRIDYGSQDQDNSQVGWLTFSSAPDEEIPQKMGPGNGTDTSFEISYKFQLNQDGDVVVGNYSTKTLMTITLGIRFFDSESGAIHPVQLTNKVRVRNLMR